jgi:UDP-N-acetylmuramate dehydrogenase
MEFLEHIALSPYTTFQIGGPARWFAEAASEDEVLQGVQFARARELPLFVLGGGSNVLVADEGFPGLVLRIALTGIQEVSRGPGFRDFSVAAGENWDAFVSHAVAQNCGGVECLAGIPGTVGGTPVQNVGAYGQEVSTTILSVKALDLSTLTFVDLSNAQCGFDYRQSIFNRTARGKFILTQVLFRLHPAAQPQLSYADLKSYFKDRLNPCLLEAAAAVREIRHAKGMVIVQGEDDCRSAGSFFKNPVLAAEDLDRLASVTRAAVPQFSAGPGLAKVPAAWLLERAGFHKGYQLGRAGISSRHTLALINRGGATAQEIVALKERIATEVMSRFGIQLEAEPVMVGPGAIG